jgi:hypothetical protein
MMGFKLSSPFDFESPASLFLVIPGDFSSSRFSLHRFWLFGFLLLILSATGLPALSGNGLLIEQA